MISRLTLTSILPNGCASDQLSFVVSAANRGSREVRRRTREAASASPARNRLMPSSASRIVPFSPAVTARSRSTGRSSGSSTRVKRYAETLRTEGTDPAYVLGCDSAVGVYTRSVGTQSRLLSCASGTVGIDMTSIEPGVYRHFKGQAYEVIGTARSTETEDGVRRLSRALRRGAPLGATPYDVGRVGRAGRLRRPTVRPGGLTDSEPARTRYAQRGGGQKPKPRDRDRRAARRADTVCRRRRRARARHPIRRAPAEVRALTLGA